MGIVPGEHIPVDKISAGKLPAVQAAGEVRNGTSTPDSVAARPARFGLATKLFAILLFLGGVAVLITSVLGYIRARDALEETIYNQLTAARQSKARQVEAYFRTIGSELRLLASTKMVVDATREFRSTFSELEQKQIPDELRWQLEEWYGQNFLPIVRRLLGKDVPLADYLPIGPAATYLQYHYIVANPQPSSRRKLVDDAGDGSAYSAVHAVYHPLLRTAASTLGLFDFMIADPKSGRLVYAMDKEADFATSLKKGPYRHSNLAAAVARCSGTPDSSLTCLEDFAPYLPSNGQPIAFMATPVIEQGAVSGVLIAQLSIEEIDRVVTGDRQWREEGFGATGEAYIIGPDSLVRSGLRLFFEDRDRYLGELKEAGVPLEEIDAIRRYGSPVLHQRIDTQATRAALAGIEGTGQVIGNRGKPTLASWGPLWISGVKWALIAKIETSEAFAPIYRLQRDLFIVGAVALLVVIVTGAWLSRSLMGPLRELTAGVRRFAAGEYSAKVPVRTRDEIGQLCSAFNGMVDELHEKNIVIENKNREAEQLLLNVLPAPIANRLRGGEQSIADGFAEVTVTFADIVGFTALSSEMPPARVVALLNGLFTRFDEAAQELGIEKIKTVGDAYMAVCGLLAPVPDHAARMVRMAIRMVHITREHAMEHRVSMKLRVGINSGPVVAGVIGKSKYIYDLWGDTVNLASRMEAGGVPDTIQVTRSVYEKLKDEFVFEPRGAIEVKGKGSVEAWLLKL
jgi:class 3 adenylate cyclase